MTIETKETPVKLNVATSSEEYASAEEMIIDEGGIDLFIDGQIELGGSFENLDNFEIAYRVLPTDFELHEEWDAENEVLLPITTEDLLENMIYRCLNELAEIRGWAK